MHLRAWIELPTDAIAQREKESDACMTRMNSCVDVWPKRDQISTFAKPRGEDIITPDICTHLFVVFMPANVTVIWNQFKTDEMIMKMMTGITMAARTKRLDISDNWFEAPARDKCNNKENNSSITLKVHFSPACISVMANTIINGGYLSNIKLANMIFRPASSISGVILLLNNELWIIESLCIRYWMNQWFWIIQMSEWLNKLLIKTVTCFVPK